MISWRFPIPGRSQTFQVTTTRFFDADEPDTDGNHGYYYAGIRYDFTQNTRQGSARRYDDTPEQASIQLARNWRDRHHKVIPYHDLFLAAIIHYLIRETPSAQLTLLRASSYLPIDIPRLLGQSRPRRP